MKKILIIQTIVLVVLLGVVVYVYLPKTTEDPAVYCTMDAKLCPDGSSVGRVGPKCEFAECPTSSAPGEDPVISKALGDSVNMHVGEKINYPKGLSLHLKGIEDSRCPERVQCIWQGELAAVFDVSMGESKEEIILGSVTKKSETFEAYKLTLVSITKSAVVIVVDPVKEVVKPPTKPIASGGCFAGGCSGEICTDQKDIASICIYKEEFACYKAAVCERQSGGQCGWTMTPELASCLKSKGLSQ